MTVAMTVAPVDAEFLDAQLAFHLNVGVDLAIAPAEVSNDEVREILDRYARDGHVFRYRGATALDDIGVAAQVAARECAADWLIAAAPTEFWWPRGAELGDVLVAVPPRYGVVQALVRNFVPRDGNEPFAERMTVRDSLDSPSAGDEFLVHRLRPLRRLERGVGLHHGQPLRAWYPIEVLRFPGTEMQVSESEGSEVAAARALEDGSLVVDERLRDALRILRVDSTYRMPAPDGMALPLATPTIVDDALYAVECAAVGEVNLDRLDRQIRELESRIAVLEQGRPRVVQRAARLVRRRFRRRS